MDPTIQSNHFKSPIGQNQNINYQAFDNNQRQTQRQPLQEQNLYMLQGHSTSNFNHVQTMEREDINCSSNMSFENQRFQKTQNLNVFQRQQNQYQCMEENQGQQQAKASQQTGNRMRVRFCESTISPNDDQSIQRKQKISELEASNQSVNFSAAETMNETTEKPKETLTRPKHVSKLQQIFNNSSKRALPMFLNDHQKKVREQMQKKCTNILGAGSGGSYSRFFNNIQTDQTIEENFQMNQEISNGPQQHQVPNLINPHQLNDTFALTSKSVRELAKRTPEKRARPNQRSGQSNQIKISDSPLIEDYRTVHINYDEWQTPSVLVSPPKEEGVGQLHAMPMSIKHQHQPIRAEKLFQDEGDGERPQPECNLQMAESEEKISSIAFNLTPNLQNQNGEIDSTYKGIQEIYQDEAIKNNEENYVYQSVQRRKFFGVDEIEYNEDTDHAKNDEIFQGFFMFKNQQENLQKNKNNAPILQPYQSQMDHANVLSKKRAQAPPSASVQYLGQSNGNFFQPVHSQSKLNQIEEQQQMIQDSSKFNVCQIVKPNKKFMKQKENQPIPLSDHGDPASVSPSQMEFIRHSLQPIIPGNNFLDTNFNSMQSSKISQISAITDKEQTLIQLKSQAISKQSKKRPLEVLYNE